MAAYYNENDAEKAAWLRELIARGQIAPGDVDERPIEVVRPEDLKGYIQCHFFAGIGVWSYALRRAGWADDTRVWTGSCPCQPFSNAGKGEGADDPRHLWPTWFRLLCVCRPDVCLGEQVAGKAGIAWLDVVLADLEGAGYTVGAADTCAAGVGAPHRRQRFYWVADSHVDGRVAPSRPGLHDAQHHAEPRGGLGDASRDGDRKYARELPGDEGEHEVRSAVGDYTSIVAGAVGGFWSDADWIACTDGKARPIEPGTFPLAHGAPARLVRLRGYGDAIVAPQAEEFIRAYLDVRGGG